MKLSSNQEDPSKTLNHQPIRRTLISFNSDLFLQKSENLIFVGLYLYFKPLFSFFLLIVSSLKKGTSGQPFFFSNWRTFGGQIV